MGDFVLAYVGIGRKPAQTDVASNNAFVPACLVGIVGVQASPSSTENGLQVQNRYPSPLKRSAHTGRPLFFRTRLREWRHGADARGLSRATVRRKRVLCANLKTSHAICGNVSPALEGDIQCANSSLLSPPWRALVLSRLVTTTQNAALWAQAQVPPCRLQQAAASPQGPFLVASLASSVTIWASANNLTFKHLTNGAGTSNDLSALFASKETTSRGDVT